MNSEMKSAKWLWGGVGLQLGTGFTVGLLVYQFGNLLTTGSFGNGFIGGLIAVIVFVAILDLLVRRSNRQLKREKTVKA